MKFKAYDHDLHRILDEPDEVAEYIKIQVNDDGTFEFTTPFDITIMPAGKKQLPKRK